MRITCCYSTGRTETGVLRMLDGQRRTLVVMCPWGQLTDEEAAEVAAAFGLGPQEP